MVDFLQSFYGKKFDPNYIVPYNVTFANKYSDALIRVVSDPNLPDLDEDGKTINFYFPEQYMLADNPNYGTEAYGKSVELLTDYHTKWKLEKWNKNFSLDAIIAVFQNFNRLYSGREWGSAMSTISCVIWYVTDDFFEDTLAAICKNKEHHVSIDMVNNYITNISELYENYHLERKPRKWLVFPNLDDEKLWQWLWNAHNEYLKLNWNTFNQKIKMNSPYWYEILRETYLKFCKGWRREADFIIRVNNDLNRDFPDRYWSEVRSICSGCVPVMANLLPWDWQHGLIDFSHWSCLEIDNWVAWQNDILSFGKEKAKSCENIIVRELKRLLPGATDSQAILYGVKRAKHRMLEVVRRSCDPYMNEGEQAIIYEYIHFLAAAFNHFLVVERYGWKAIQD